MLSVRSASRIGVRISERYAVNELSRQGRKSSLHLAVTRSASVSSEEIIPPIRHTSTLLLSRPNSSPILAEKLLIQSSLQIALLRSSVMPQIELHSMASQPHHVADLAI